MAIILKLELVTNDVYLWRYSRPTGDCNDRENRGDKPQVPEEIEQHSRRAEPALPNVFNLSCECEAVVEAEEG